MLTTIALDCGNVLACPASGNWFMPTNLPRFLGTRNMMIMASNAQAIEENMRGAQAFISANHLMHTEEEEFELFKECYRIVFGGCGFEGLDIIAEALAHDIVYNDARDAFYDDVLPGIRALKECWRVVVISDAGPSLRRVLAASGVLPLLDGLVISCHYGHSKFDDGKLFLSAIEHHDVVPEETLFVDDSADNLIYAKELGFYTAQMDREGKLDASEYPLVHTLDEVMALAMQIH